MPSDEPTHEVTGEKNSSKPDLQEASPETQKLTKALARMNRTLAWSNWAKIILIVIWVVVLFCLYFIR